MKRKIAWIMAALLTVSSVEPATVLSVSAQEVTEADGWTADEGLAEAEDNESAENFTDAEATEDVGDIVAEDGFTSETDGFVSSDSLPEDEGGESIFPAEDTITSMELDKPYDAQVHEGESVWFRFEPTVSGKYSFSSQGESDTMGALYSAEEKQLALNDDGQTDKNFEISYNLEAGNRYYLETGLTDAQEGTYTVSVAQVEEGSTEELGTPDDDIVKVESVKLVHSSQYYTGMDRLCPSNIKLYVTYENGDTAFFPASNQYDEYDNLFRLKLVLADENAILTGSGIGLDEEHFLINSGVILGTAGVYKLQLYLNQSDQAIAESDVVVCDMPDESTIPVIEEEKEFAVSGGMELFRFTPKKDGQYYLSEAPEHEVEEIIDGTYRDQLINAWLTAGKEYTFRYDGEAGNAMIEAIPELTGVSLKSEPRFLEQCTQTSALENIGFIGHYSNGKDYEVNSDLEDYWVRYVDYSVTDSNGRHMHYNEELPAGDYKVQISVDDGDAGEAECSFRVYSFIEFANQSISTGKRQVLKSSEDFANCTIFSYTPEEDGVYRFETYAGNNDMYCSDEAGNVVYLDYQYSHDDDGINTSDYYFVKLSKGHTYYFALKGTDNYIAVKTVKVGKTIKSAVLRNDEVYYENLDKIHGSDFYLDLTYDDGTIGRVRVGRIGVNGETFRLEIEETGNTLAVTGGSISLAGGEYVVKAYLGESQEPIAQMTVQVKSTDCNQLRTVKEGETFHVGGQSSEVVCFSPAETGYYYIAGIPEYCDADFYRFAKGRYYRVSNQYMTAGEKCLVEYTGGEQADLTIGRHPDESSKPFEIQLNKKYENLTIGSEYERVEFTYVPEETGVYQLDLATADKAGLTVSLRNENEASRSYHGQDQIQMVLKKDAKYSFYIGCGGEYKRGAYTFSAMLTRLTDRSAAPLNIQIIEKGSSTAGIGIEGVDTLDSMLKRMTLWFHYNETFYSSRNRVEVQLGENTDKYGNRYTVSVEDVSKDQEKKEYKLKVTCGDIYTETILMLYNPEKMEEITEGQKVNISYGQDNVYTQKKICYRFLAKEDKYYALNFASTENIDGIEVIVHDETGEEISYNYKNDGYKLNEGKTYYFEIVCSGHNAGNTSISIDNAKSIADIEVIQEPYEAYGSYGFLEPIFDGARFKVTYSDGTQSEVGFSEACGSVGYPRIYANVYWSVDRKTFDVQYSIGGSYKTEKKTYNAVSKEEAAVLPVSQKQTVDFGTGYHRRLFKVQINEDGNYSVKTSNQNLKGYFIDGQGNFIYTDNGTYSLKKGEVYYALICGSGSGTAVVENESCDHNYTWVIDKAATCSEAGSQHEVCSKCGLAKAPVEIPATGAHQYQIIVDKAATCGEAGSQHEVCSKCGLAKAPVEIPATGAHQYQTIVDKAATCGEMGSQHEECVVCHTQKPAVEIPATGAHTFTEYTVVTEPSISATGLKERKCTVCGKTEQVVMEKAKATISVAAKKITIATGKSVAAPKVTFAKGDKIVSWKSSRKSVATVSKKGKITAKKAGKTTITVTLKSKKTAKITVTVKDKIPATSIKADVKTLSLKKGKSYQLKTTVKPLNTTDKVTFKSSNKKVATVSAKGKIKAKKKGKATITITAGKKKVTCKVTVK